MRHHSRFARQGARLLSLQDVSSDQQDSVRDTILGLRSIAVLRGRGTGREVIEPVSHSHHLHSWPHHESEEVAAVSVMINCFEVSLFMYLLLFCIVLLRISCVFFTIKNIRLNKYYYNYLKPLFQYTICYTTDRKHFQKVV